MKIISLFIFNLFLVCAAEIVVAEEASYYSFKDIKFREKSFPEKIEVFLYIPATSKLHPDMVAVNGNAITNIGAEIKVFEEKDGMIKILVGLNIDDCQHLMNNKFDWKLSSVQGSEIIIDKNQSFIPVIYFEHCMIGFSVGKELEKDPSIQNWFKK